MSGDTKRSFEDHGTTVTTTPELECTITGCSESPTHEMNGRMYFELDGDFYSRDSVLLCTGHLERITRNLRTGTDRFGGAE